MMVVVVVVVGLVTHVDICTSADQVPQHFSLAHVAGVMNGVAPAAEYAVHVHLCEATALSTPHNT
jgi:hypothetical protein